MTAGAATPRLVIGVGNPDSGDDAAGRLVARRLADRNACAPEPAALVIRECSGEATALMDAWTGFDDVVLVDACNGAGETGSIHRFSASDVARLAALGQRQRGSTHGLGLSAALALSRALGTQPCRLVIYAIEGRHFRAGEPLSPGVDHAIDELVALLVQYLSAAAHSLKPAGDP
jgi:hydrogenase maturation protease